MLFTISDIILVCELYNVRRQTDSEKHRCKLRYTFYRQIIVTYTIRDWPNSIGFGNNNAVISEKSDRKFIYIDAQFSKIFVSQIVTLSPEIVVYTESSCADALPTISNKQARITIICIKCFNFIHPQVPESSF